MILEFMTMFYIRKINYYKVNLQRAGEFMTFLKNLSPNSDAQEEHACSPAPPSIDNTASAEKLIMTINKKGDRRLYVKYGPAQRTL